MEPQELVTIVAREIAEACNRIVARIASLEEKPASRRDTKPEQAPLPLKTGKKSRSGSSDARQLAMDRPGVRVGTLVPGVTCPKCGAGMKLRARRLDNARFYGCEKFPECDGIVNLGEHDNSSKEDEIPF